MPDALELLSYSRSRYGENHLNVLRAAWRAGKTRSKPTSTPDDAMIAVASPFQKLEANCGTTIRLGARPVGQNHNGQYHSAATVANRKRRGFTMKITGTKTVSRKLRKKL
jgi:hypothetical protein